MNLEGVPSDPLSLMGGLLTFRQNWLFQENNDFPTLPLAFGKRVGMLSENGTFSNRGPGLVRPMEVNVITDDSESHTTVLDSFKQIPIHTIVSTLPLVMQASQ